MVSVNQVAWVLIGLGGVWGSSLWLYAYWVADDAYLGGIAIGILLLFAVTCIFGKLIETPSKAA